MVTGRIGPRFVLLIFLSVSQFSCGQGLRGSQASSQPWTIGFWLWSGAQHDAAAAGSHPFDVLYVQVGRVDSFWKNAVSWPLQGKMPPAVEFWALWRYDPPAGLADAQIPAIAGDFAKRKKEAATHGQSFVGVQLDYDCPTVDLAEYAAFVKKLGKALPAGTKISITALRDWFRTGTRIREVLAHTNEFVPQFYDTRMSQEGAPGGIAEPIDAARLASPALAGAAAILVVSAVLACGPYISLRPYLTRSFWLPMSYPADLLLPSGRVHSPAPYAGFITGSVPAELADLRAAYSPLAQTMKQGLPQPACEDSRRAASRALFPGVQAGKDLEDKVNGDSHQCPKCQDVKESMRSQTGLIRKGDTGDCPHPHPPKLARAAAQMHEKRERPWMG